MFFFLSDPGRANGKLVRFGVGRANRLESRPEKQTNFPIRFRIHMARNMRASALRLKWLIRNETASAAVARER